MKDRSFISAIGILIYLVLSVTDRFIYKIPNYLYIPIAITTIAVVILGFVIDKMKKGATRVEKDSVKEE